MILKLKAILRKHTYLILFWLAYFIVLCSHFNKSAYHVVFATLPFVVLMVMYFTKATTRHLLFFCFLLFYAVGDILFVYRIFLIGTLTYVLSNLSFIGVLLYHRVSINTNRLFRYVLLFVILFFIVYFTVVDRALKGNFPVIVYGLSLSFMMAISFMNYLNKMNSKNLLIFIGVFIKVISDCLFSIELYDSLDNDWLIIVIEAMFLLALYIITLGVLKK